MLSNNIIEKGLAMKSATKEEKEIVRKKIASAKKEIVVARAKLEVLTEQLELFERLQVIATRFKHGCW